MNEIAIYENSRISFFIGFDKTIFPHIRNEEITEFAHEKFEEIFDDKLTSEELKEVGKAYAILYLQEKGML